MSKTKTSGSIQDHETERELISDVSFQNLHQVIAQTV